MPRIPKRKQPTPSDIETDKVSSDEKSAGGYQSVLERIESSTSRGLGSFPNWAKSGWKRSDTAKSSEKKPTWNRNNSNNANKSRWNEQKFFKQGSTRTQKDGKSDSEPVKRKSLEKPVKECSSKSNSKAAELSVSLTLPDLVDPPSDDELNGVSTFPLSLNGPLPSLSFEEQMKERARLRSLRMASSSDLTSANDNVCSSDAEPTNELSLFVDSCSSDAPETATTANSCKPTSESQKHLDKPAKSVEQKHQTKAAESHSVFEKRQKSERTSTRDILKSKQPHQSPSKSSRKQKNAGVFSPSLPSSVSVSKPSSSPSYPVLPVLPLFAPKNSDSTTDISSSRPLTESQGSKSSAVSSKTVTFDCPEGKNASPGSDQTNKPKKTSDQKPSLSVR